MSVRIALGIGLFAALLCSFSPAAQGQGLLERLEKRLEGVLDEAAPAIAPPATPSTVPAAPSAPTSRLVTPVPEPGYLGLIGDDRDEAGRGVRVVTVRAGSPAEAAGLRVGDFLVAVDRVSITKLDDLARQLETKPAGSKVEFEIERDSVTQSVLVTLTRRAAPLSSENQPPSNVLPAPRGAVVRRADEPPPAEPSRIESVRPSLGIAILPVTEEARRRYRLAVRQGALIGSITPGSAADRAGLAVGSVVVAAEGRRIEQPEDLIDVIQHAEPGDELMLSYYQGGTLYRKSVRLAEAAVETPSEEPGGEAFREGDRPLLRRLERALGGAAVPERSTPVPPLAPVPHEAEGRPDELRAEVDRLRARVDDLERRLAALEDGAKDETVQDETVRGEADAEQRPAAARVPPPRPEPPAAEAAGTKPENAAPVEESDPAAEPALELKPPAAPPAPPQAEAR